MPLIALRAHLPHREQGHKRRWRQAKAADEPATTQSKANTTQVGQETLDEVRKALPQPPSFAFTQYLRGLRSRWTQRPLVSLGALRVGPSHRAGITAFTIIRWRRSRGPRRPWRLP